MKHAFSRAIGGYQDTQFDSYVEDGGSEQSPYVFIQQGSRDIEQYSANALEKQIEEQPKIEVIPNDPKAPLPRAGFVIDSLIDNQPYNFSETKKNHQEKEEEMRTLGDYITTQQADTQYDANGTPINVAMNTPDTYSSLPRFGSRKDLGRYVDSNGSDATNVDTGYLDSLKVNETQAKTNPEANFITSSQANRIYDTNGTPLTKAEETSPEYHNLPQFVFGKKTMSNVVQYFDAYQQRHDDLSGYGSSLSAFSETSPQHAILNVSSGHSISNTDSSSTDSSSTDSGSTDSGSLYNRTTSTLFRTPTAKSRSTVEYGGKTLYDQSRLNIRRVAPQNEFVRSTDSGGSQSVNTSDGGTLNLNQANQVANAMAEQLVAYKQKAIEELYNMDITLTTDEYNAIMGANSIAEVDAVIEQVSVRIANEIEQQQQEQETYSNDYDGLQIHGQALIPVYNDNGDLIGHYSDSSRTNFIPLDNQGGGSEITIIDNGEIVDGGGEIIDGGGEIVEGGGTVGAQKQEGLSTGLIVGSGIAIGLGIFAFMKLRNR